MKQTFFQRCLLVLLETFHCNRLQADPGSWVLLQNVPHVLLAEHKQVTVADRTYAGRPPVAYEGDGGRADEGEE